MRERVRERASAWLACVRGGQLLSVEDHHETAKVSLEQALPSLKQAMGLTLPCRELCEAIFSRCSCQNDHTSEFDQLILSVEDPFNYNVFTTNPPPTFPLFLVGELIRAAQASLRISTAGPHATLWQRLRKAVRRSLFMHHVIHVPFQACISFHSIPVPNLCEGGVRNLIFKGKFTIQRCACNLCERVTLKITLRMLSRKVDPLFSGASLKILSNKLVW